MNLVGHEELPFVGMSHPFVGAEQGRVAISIKRAEDLRSAVEGDSACKLMIRS